jgi:hypothetical protein
MKTLVLGALVLKASLAMAYDIHSDYDHSAEFYRYKTFMWVDEPPAPDPFTQRLMVRTINSELEAKGLRLVTSDADLVVSATTATCNYEPFYAFVPGGWSWYLNWFPQPSITVVHTFEGGSLVVNLVDTQTDQVVWWASGTETVSEEGAKRIRHLHTGVRKMFETFPPWL